MGIKKLFYLLRPLLAARWIASQRTMPPTRFEFLVAAPFVRAEERTWIGALLAKKAVAAEAEPLFFDPERREAYACEIEQLAALGPTLVGPRERSTGELDAVLLRWAGVGG